MAEVISIGVQTPANKKYNEKKKAILQAIIDIVVEGGYPALKLSDVAIKANVAISTVRAYEDQYKLLNDSLNYIFVRYIEFITRTEIFEVPINERPQLFVALSWRHYKSADYLASLEILLSAHRGWGKKPFTLEDSSLWNEYLGHTRAIFDVAHMNDRELSQVMTTVHNALTGLSLQLVVYPSTANVGGYLRNIITSFTAALENKKT